MALSLPGCHFQLGRGTSTRVVALSEVPPSYYVWNPVCRNLLFSFAGDHAVDVKVPFGGVRGESQLPEFLGCFLSQIRKDKATKSRVYGDPQG